MPIAKMVPGDPEPKKPAFPTTHWLAVQSLSAVAKQACKDRNRDPSGAGCLPEHHPFPGGERSNNIPGL
jgi:hypothetical protein